MRKILILIAVLWGLSVSGQVKQTYPQYGGKWKRLVADSAFGLPKTAVGLKDQNLGFDTAQIRYNIGDSAVYVYTGSQWILLRGAIGSTPTWQQTLTAGSTLTQTNNITIGNPNILNFKWNNDSYFKYLWSLNDPVINIYLQGVAGGHPNQSSFNELAPDLVTWSVGGLQSTIANMKINMLDDTTGQFIANAGGDSRFFHLQGQSNGTDNVNDTYFTMTFNNAGVGTWANKYLADSSGISISAASSSAGTFRGLKVNRSGAFGLGDISSPSYGTAGQVLVSNGQNSTASWSSSPSALTLPISSLTAALANNTVNGAGFNFGINNLSNFDVTGTSLITLTTGASPTSAISIYPSSIQMIANAGGHDTRFRVYTDSIVANPMLGRYYIDTLNYTLSTTGKKVMLRDTVTGLVENIDPSLIGGGGGVTTMAAIGSTPNANGATISGVNLNLEPASASFGGVVTTGAQTFAGVKTLATPVFTTSAQTPLLIGGTAVGSTLTIQSTTADGTDATEGIVFQDGAVKFGAILNSGQWGIGTGTTASATYGMTIRQPNDGASNNALRLLANNGTTQMTLGYGKITTGGAMILESQSSNTQMLYKVFIGTTTTPTAVLHLNGGTTAASTAPLKFTTGSLMTVAEAGAVEYTTPNFYVTAGDAVRYTLAKTLTATATLNFGNTAAGVAADLTVTVTGAADGDAVYVGVPTGSVSADNTNYWGWVSAANTVTVRFNNNNLVAAVDPASGTFRVVVTKY